MNRESEPAMNMSATFAGSSRDATRRRNPGTEMRFGQTRQEQLNQEVPQILEEGRAVLQGLRAPGFTSTSIEQELSAFLQQFSAPGIRCEVSMTGHPKELKPAIQGQINLIGREALVNALLHSQATRIEAEVEYSRRRVRVVVRDNGRGIDPEVARTRSNARRGLAGMRERAESIGAKLTIWSRLGVGTEVEISVPSQALANACA